MTISKEGLLAGDPQTPNKIIDRVQAEIDSQVSVLTGISSGELGFLDGVTAGTSAASKAVVLSSASKINELDITALKLNGTACDEAFLAGAKSATTIAALSLTVSLADATTLTTVLALANDEKSKLNSVINKVDDILAKLKTSGIISAS